MMRNFSGACIRRVIDRSGAQVPEHAHDWPVLSLFVLGSYRNETQIGERSISGPSAVFYRAGAHHRNTTAAVGFEQIEIEFDPAWLGAQAVPSAPVVRWIGGEAGAHARRLARFCEEELSESGLREALGGFLRGACAQTELATADWVGTVTRRLREDTSLRLHELAREVGLHPSWMGTAYRRVTGESVLEAVARIRVERATCQLRETDRPCAAIALDAGFCDQSHMNRTFQRVLGRSPALVRQQRSALRQSAG